MTNLKPPPVHKVIVAQLAAITLVAIVSLLFSGSIVAYSLLLGGLISALPNAFFAAQAFKYRGARNAKKVVKSFMRGEIGKIAMTIGLFALCFGLITTLNELALILGFMATHFIGIVASMRIDYTPTGKRT